MVGDFWITYKGVDYLIYNFEALCNVFDIVDSLGVELDTWED